MFLKRILLSIGYLGFLLTAYGQEDFQFDLDQLKIEHQTYTLSNGLTLIVHEDTKAPIVAVNVWYHVGSKNEPEGKTGFAHLFEHLMFNGSENFNDDYFQAMESIGATTLNGTTWFDRTNYFQNVPKEALDVALFMESDRMGHFKGAITQERLDEQRDVVKNEKRQGDNQPYGKTEYRVLANCYPAGHPYSHSTIGSMDDLNDASLEDVKEWFSKYYGAANAVVVVAGDISADEAYERVNEYFGDVEPGPPVTHPQVNIAKRSGTIEEVMQDNVPQVRYYMVWNVPEFGSQEVTYLDLTANVLSSGKNSRLYKRLVYDNQIASSVRAYVEDNEIGSRFYIEADVKPGVTPEKVKMAINEELRRFLKEGPTQEELNRIKTQYFADFTRGIEGIGGFGGKSDILARYQVYQGEAAHYMQVLEWVKSATAADLKETASNWLSDGLYLLKVVPFPKYNAVATEVDRSKGLPELGKASEVKFPNVQEATLSNGIRVLLAERHNVPLVEMSLRLNAGYSADQGGKPGTAQLTLSMLDEGSKNRNALEISKLEQSLGAEIGTGSSLDESFVSLSALVPRLDESLDLWADIILNPAFPQADFERLKQQQMVSIQQEKAQPVAMALRVFPKLMYGEDHAYGVPFTGSGYEGTVSNIGREDLINFYNTWFKPNNATLTVAGDITMDELKPKLESLFKKWKEGTVPEKNLASVAVPKNKVYLMDRPGSPQTVLFAGYPVAPYGQVSEEARQMMNNILGGEFTSRINMNLREDKGWAYGAFSLIFNAKGQRPFLIYAPVQTDKAAESMEEIQKELSGYISDNPPTSKELEKTKKNEVLQLPGQWESLGSVLSSLNQIVSYNLSRDYYEGYADQVRGVAVGDIQAVAEEFVNPKALSWVVIGDRAQIEEKIKALGYGEIVRIDADGNVLSFEEQQLGVEGQD